MPEDPASLDRMHDLALPPQVPWWPLAPGWYVVIALLLVLALLLAHRIWSHWRRNAYRRAALHQLATCGDSPAVAELLRRTALAIVPRSEVAAKSGSDWTDWLDTCAPATMPAAVKEHLITGPYAAPVPVTPELLGYARDWIRHHRLPA
ncbi:DUF4381 domain-containing protein [Luteolibacter marinus]|uniref:DUF4381 domain-containing protein n=1 Tax=Luteolibacter marinus TaxID=2776705 RepID=UPI0018681A52|nr:DUF4381 domain-containing protein [Luteolibacter marinus]